MKITPFYDRYPKDPVENLKWRLRCRERARTDLHFRHALYDACMEDLLFWMGFACIGEGTRVVTDRGPVPIEEVTRDDLVWDGEEWVCQKGAVSKGSKPSIFAHKIWLTPDHEVWTTHGWNAACTGWDRADVRLPDGYRERWRLPDYEASGDNAPVSEVGCDDRLQAGNRTHVIAQYKQVFDLIDCGPRSAFTVLDSEGRPLIVHNCWSFEPRAKVKIRPFVPWPHQEHVFVAMDKAIDDAASEERSMDVLLDKSRAQGGTFGYLWIDLRRWLRDPMFSAGYVTRNEALIDSKIDSDTLFWKLDWAIRRLPFWMVPKGLDWKKHRNYTSHSWINPANGASLVGYAAGQDVGMGGRKSVFTCDEFGARDFVSGGKDEAVMESLHDVTNVVRMVSARYIDQGVFHQACEDHDSNGLHLILDWKDNPIHSRNSYVVKDGKPVARKPEDQGAVNEYHAENRDLRRRLERKGFKFEDLVRSPWYDMRCLRPTSTPRLIASQLDRDPRGAVGKVFPSDLLDRMKTEHCKRPIWSGSPVFDTETLALQGLLSREDGPLKLWFQPGPDDSCPLGPFTVGCDIATGSDGAYSSNSVASIIDDRTGEQVGEYAIKGMPSIKFARNVVGLCLWLRNAMLGWEDSGMARPFAKEIMEVLYYGHVYFRSVEAVGQKVKTRKPGWWNGKDEHKADLFEQMALAMEAGLYTPRSADLIRECGEYEWDRGKIIHAPTKSRGAQEKAHGDRCIAGGVAYLVYEENQFGLDTHEHSRDTSIEYGSWLWRENQERQRRTSDDPEFGILDIL
jgi:hypothetical protein